MALAAVAGLFFAGCASSPFPEALNRQAQPLTIAQVSANPAASTGNVVVWGGSIIKTVNQTNRGDIYILAYPLGSDQRPDQYKPSIGRFIARHNGLADPEEFLTGRLITVLGAVSGGEREPIQNTTYDYPVVSIEQTKVWRPISTPNYGYYGPGYYDDWLLFPYGPGWWGPPVIVGGGRPLPGGHH